MDIDLNKYYENDTFSEILGEDVDEVNFYRIFEDVYRANERINDDVGIMELTYDWDLNIEYVDNEVVLDNEAVPYQVRNFHNVACDDDRNVEVEGVVAGQELVGGEVDDMDDEEHQLSAPFIDDEFDSIDEAYQYYLIFAKQCGFSVFKRSHHKKRGTDIVHPYVFACSKCRPEETHIGERVPDRKRPVVAGCTSCFKVIDPNLSGT